MVRTQIQLDERTYKEIKRMAYEREESMAEVIRSLIARGLEAPDEPSRPLEISDFPIIGKYCSGKKDISERHDDYLGEDFD